MADASLLQDRRHKQELPGAVSCALELLRGPQPTTMALQDRGVEAQWMCVRQIGKP